MFIKKLKEFNKDLYMKLLSQGNTLERIDSYVHDIELHLHNQDIMINKLAELYQRIEYQKLDEIDNLQIFFKINDGIYVGSINDFRLDDNGNFTLKGQAYKKQKDFL